MEVFLAFPVSVLGWWDVSIYLRVCLPFLILGPKMVVGDTAAARDVSLVV